MKLNTSLLALIAACGMSTQAQAVIFTVTGDTTGAPTYNRPIEDLTVLSGVGTAVQHDTLTFVASLSGSYTFLTTGSFDTFVTLYTGSFSPVSALTNAVVANDDLLPGFTTSGFASSLIAGTTYVYVTTGFANSDFGVYSTTIGGPGVISLVPELQSYAMLVLGLGLIGAWRRRQVAANA